MLRRLSEFRARNTDTNTSLNFFDECERHPKLISVEEYDTIEAVFDIACDRIGPPKHFMLTRIEIELGNIKKREQEKNQQHEKELKEQQQLDKVRRQREKAMEDWTQLFEKLREEEEALLASQVIKIIFQ